MNSIFGNSCSYWYCSNALYPLVLYNKLISNSNLMLFFVLYDSYVAFNFSILVRQISMYLKTRFLELFHLISVISSLVLILTVCFPMLGIPFVLLSIWLQFLTTCYSFRCFGRVFPEIFLSKVKVFFFIKTKLAFLKFDLYL